MYPQVMPKDFTGPAKVDRCTIVPTFMNGGTMMHMDEHGAQECTKGAHVCKETHVQIMAQRCTGVHKASELAHNK